LAKLISSRKVKKTNMQYLFDCSTFLTHNY